MTSELATPGHRSDNRLTRFDGWCGVTCLAIAILLMAMPPLRYLSLHSNFFDLGQYAQYHHWLAFGGSWRELITSHAHLVALPYALIYRIVPGSITLLTVQSLIIVGSAFLYFRLCRVRQLHSPFFGPLIFLLSISTWFGALFDFHFEHLIFPIIFGFFLLVERTSTTVVQIGAVVLGMLLCLVKEVYPLSAAMLGLYLIFSRRWLIAGLTLFVFSIGYFAVMTTWIIPAFTDGRGIGELWQSAFGYLGPDITSIVIRLIKEPWLPFVEMATTPRKLVYIFVLFGALALVPLRKPLVLLPALPILAISMLSRNPSHYYLGHQYTVMVTAVALVAATHSLSSWSPKIASRAVRAMLVCSLAAQILFGPSPISRLFWSPSIFNFHWSAYITDVRSQRLKGLIDSFIPPDDTVAVSIQNSLNTDRLSDRKFAFAFPDGIIEPVRFYEASASGGNPSIRPIWADYVVLDRLRPLSIRDEICLFDRDKICRDPVFLEKYDRLLAYLANELEVLHEEDGMMILRRKSKAR